jgi:ribosome-binding protein aMBF1 (putative translation factor)
MAQTLNLAGKKFRIIPESEYQRLIKRQSPELPPMPKRLPNGNYPAVESARVDVARHIILARRKAGLSQAELARRAGIRVETLNRLEKAKHTADVATVDKISKALDAAAKETVSAKSSS